MIRSQKLLFACLLLGALSFPQVVKANISDWQKGITIRLNNQTTADVDYSLSELKKTNANFVTITPGYLSDNEFTSNVDRKPGTPSDAILIYTINKAHSLGLKVFLKPHLDLKNNLWRANLNPTNKSLFFQNYKSMILHNAQIAQDTNCELFSVGAELVLLTTNIDNKSYWEDIISDIRKVYTGKITYSANAGIGNVDETKLTFWDKLDFLGLSMYMSLSDTNTPTLQSLANAWKAIDVDYVSKFQQDYPSKPLIFTEMGFRSVDGASTKPWDYSFTANVDLNEQYLMYQSFFDYWSDKSYFKGVHIWDWQVKQNAGGFLDIDYNFQNKPALSLVTARFNTNTVLPTIIVPTVIPIITPSIIPSILPTVSNVDNLTISKILPTSYKLDTLKVGGTFFVDRPYLIKELPVGFENFAIIKTKNSDKTSTKGTLVSFNISKGSDIYIAYDSRIKQTPSWLNAFSKTSFLIKTNDTTFNLYKKSFDSGDIFFGGNIPVGLNQSNISSYFIIFPSSNFNSAISPLATPIPNIIILTPTETQSVLPTVVVDSEMYLNKDIIIVEPDSGSILSGEKKIKIQIDGLSLNTYSAIVSINGVEYNLTDSSDLLYKQMKFDYDTLNLANSSATLVFKAKDISGTVFAQKTLVLPFN